jgi:transmembrane sensor
MTLMQRIQRAAQGVEPGWDERDVDRVWQGLQRKRRRRGIAAGAAVAAAGVAAWAIFFVSSRYAVVRPAGPSAGAPPAALAAQPPERGELRRFADGSTAVRLGGHEAELNVAEDTPQRVVLTLVRGGAQFEVVPRADRSFSVRAGEVTVSVVGTAFSVERVADRVGVTVRHGIVQVEWGTGARRMVAGDEGWFPPLVVSRRSGTGEAEHAAQETRSAPHRRKPVAPPEDGVPPSAPTAVPAAAPAPDAAKLLADADRARLAGHYDEGASLLERLVREHPDDPRAPLAAFSLGRLLLGELGRPAEAARAFARARALAPDGPLAREALAREAEAWARAGDRARAEAREAEYRAHAPTNSGPRP